MIITYKRFVLVINHKKGSEAYVNSKCLHGASVTITGNNIIKVSFHKVIPKHSIFPNPADMHLIFIRSLPCLESTKENRLRFQRQAGGRRGGTLSIHDYKS